MQLNLKNVNLIRHAEITLNGLTVIAGENDTGKSTIGKILFSLIKSLNQYDKGFSDDKKINIQEKIEHIYRQVRSMFRFDDHPELKRAFFPRTFFKEMSQVIHFSAAPYQADEIKSLIKKKIHQLENSPMPSQEGNGFTDLIQDIQALRKLVLNLLPGKAMADSVKPVLSRILASEFSSELISQYAGVQQANIILSEGHNPILSLDISADTMQLDIADGLLLTEASFVETPIILQLYDLINSASERRTRLPYHLVDLIDKLKNVQYLSDTLVDEQAPLFGPSANTRTLMQGGFDFDDANQDFVFRRDHGPAHTLSIKPVNTASGIKAFGIIQLLMHADLLDEKHLLIVDEPETHLHPAWQVEYARLMIALVKRGIPVLLTSHSPYVIQALNVEGKKAGLESKMNYYLAECDEEGRSNITEVSEDLNQVFIKLSAPLQNLVWDQ